MNELFLRRTLVLSEPCWAHAQYADVYTNSTSVRRKERW